MPDIGDKVRIKMITEMQGVQMATALYFEVTDLTGGPTIQEILFDTASEWHIAWRSFCSDQFKITCAIWKNYTNPIEPDIPLFVNLAGLEVVDGPHPASTVVWVSRYGVHATSGKLVRSRVALSGLTKNKSIRGRVLDDMEVATVESFFRNDFISVASGFTLKNQVRYRLDVGPPKTFTQSDLTQAQMQGEFTKLQSRQTNLCAVP